MVVWLSLNLGGMSTFTRTQGKDNLDVGLIYSEPAATAERITTGASPFIAETHLGLVSAMTGIIT